MNESALIAIIEASAERALNGTLTDTDRVGLLRLALTAAAAELHRIESIHGGTVSPEALLLIQQLGLLCEEGVDIHRLLGGMGLLEENEDAEVEDSGGSEPPTG